MYIDLKYVKLLSPQLKNFKQTDSHTFNFSCPICGDSKKDTKKARGYLFAGKSKLFYKCHNCGTPSTFKKILQSIDDNLYNEYVDECKSDLMYGKIDLTPQRIISEPKINNNYLLSCTDNITLLSDDHIAKKYINNRQIPESSQYDLYYINDLNVLANQLDKYKINKSKFYSTDYIIIPIRNKFDTITHIQARLITPTNDKFRFITLQVIKNTVKLYGINNIDKNNENIYIVEGAFDSMFIDNSMAMMGSSVNIKNIKGNLIFIYDNEPHNDEIMKLMKRRIENGYNVVIWGTLVGAIKDINDMILANVFKNKFNLLEYIKLHTFKGEKAMIKFEEYIK